MNNLINYISTAPRKITKSTTVGIPRAMYFHEHGRLWENFLTLLGCNVVISPATNRRILDLGVKNTSSETCLPVKVMAGHVLALADKADVIFIPRYISTEKNEFTCPKVCSLPDMIRLSLKTTVDIMEVALDLHHSGQKTDDSLERVAERLELEPDDVRGAYLKAVKNRMRANMEAAVLHELPTRPSVAVLGHPYMLGDSYISMDILSKLRAHGFDVLIPSSLDYDLKRGNAYPYYHDKIFYGTGVDNLGAAFLFAEQPCVKGIIYITPFGCGVDSLVTEFIERHLKTINNKTPYMKITVDEHTGEAGFDTRIEAFIDMIGGAK